MLRVDNPDKGTERRVAGACFVEPEFLLCYARLICIIKFEETGEPCALVQWYESHMESGQREREHRQGGDVYVHPGLPLLPCLKLQNSFDIVSLHANVEGCVWVAQDFDDERRYWHIRHRPLPASC